MMALVDDQSDYGRAIAACRSSVELAGATVVTIAVGELTPFNHPGCCFGHLLLQLPTRAAG